MEILNEIWQTIAPYEAGIYVSGIISAVIYGCLKGAVNRTINKINVEKIAEQATDKGVERVKTVSFKHSIQPLVESELAKIDENVAKRFTEELKKVQDNYNKLVAILEKLSAYFDGSIGVTEQAKAELKEAIEEAKTEPKTPETVETEEVIIEEPKPAVEVQKTPQKAHKAVR